MYGHRHLPFLGLLVLASFVAMVAGVGDVSERTSTSDRARAEAATDVPAMRPGRRDP